MYLAFASSIKISHLMNFSFQLLAFLDDTIFSVNFILHTAMEKNVIPKDFNSMNKKFWNRS